MRGFEGKNQKRRLAQNQQVAEIEEKKQENNWKCQFSFDSKFGESYQIKWKDKFKKLEAMS